MLRVQLRDFTDWLIYEKHYTSEDIGEGKPINRKADLEDIFNILARKVGAEASTAHNRITQCSFGDVIRNNGIACYRAERGGNITVFDTVVGTAAKRTCCDSHLELEQVRKMTEAERVAELSRVERMRLVQSLENEI